MDKETEKAMKKDNILHLTLKKKYFDEILSGKKKKEYRELKPYWISTVSYTHLTLPTIVGV